MYENYSRNSMKKPRQGLVIKAEKVTGSHDVPYSKTDLVSASAE